MKNQFLKINLAILLTFFIVSCSSSDSNDENIPDENEATIKYLESSTREEYLDYYGYYRDTLVYENGKLVKALFFGCSGMMYQFEYGANNKVSEFYHGTGFNTEDLKKDLSQPTNSTKKTVMTYDASNTLTKQETFRRFQMSEWEQELKLNFTYDEFNRINTVTYTEEHGVSEVRVVEFDANGNMVKDDSGWTYEYDNNPNPYYVLFKEFGVFNIESCTVLEMRYGHLSPNNLLKVYDDEGTLRYFNDFVYDEDGYPIEVSFSDTNGDISGKEVYSYRKLN